MLNRISLTHSFPIKNIKIIPNTTDEPIVPKFRPPLSTDLVNKSPKVAPNGRVKIKEIQNKTTLEVLVKKNKLLKTSSKLPIKKAPPLNPNPESSARKSPKAVPNVLENKIVNQ